MTRLGEISPLRHNFKSLLKNFKRLWLFLKVYLVFGEIVNLLWWIFLCFWANFIVYNGQILIKIIKPSGHIGWWGHWHAETMNLLNLLIFSSWPDPPKKFWGQTTASGSVKFSVTNMA